jgi:Holliday junction resolvase RusA-like endonuclease
MTSIAFDVLGTPAPKGSAQAFIVGKRGGPQRAVVAPGGSSTTRARMKGWDAAVRDAARACIGDVYAPPFVDSPLVVGITFRMARPQGHWGKGRNAGQLSSGAPVFPRSKPDIDKLARATLDALTGIVFDDDSRIAELVLRKRYAAPGEEGAHVQVGRLDGAA